MTHEAAHALLHHAPGAGLRPGRLRHLDPGQEDEARFLRTALLLTEEAAMDVVRRRVPEREAAARSGITPKLLHYRINVTGARNRVAQATRRQTVSA
jgi:hypothetical protein